MKIVRLLAENVKRLHAVEITPDGALVTIGGKNGAGKSSVLDSIAYAMGGEKLVPSEPIRAGEAEAKVVVDLGDLVVTRKFKREKVHLSEGFSKEGNAWDWSETKSTLTVTNKEGARYPSPQAVLDGLLGRLTFDPLAFARDEPKRQDETLRKLIGLDVTAIDERRKLAAAQRAMLKKSHAIKEAQALALPKHDGVPATEIAMDAIANEMRQAEEYRRLADDARRDVDKAKDVVSAANDKVGRIEAVLDEARKQIVKLEDQLKEAGTAYDDALKALDARQITADAALAVVPDAAAIRAKLSEVETTNAKVRANKKHEETMVEVARLADEIAAQQTIVEQMDVEKQTALTAAKFPVLGLSLGDDGVMFNGLPFAQAGSAEQVRVSMAIGIALNPQLKVLLIRNGNILDSESLKMVAEQAEAADMQVWMEYVSESKEGVTVMLVDGEVA